MFVFLQMLYISHFTHLSRKQNSNMEVDAKSFSEVQIDPNWNGSQLTRWLQANSITSEAVLEQMQNVSGINWERHVIKFVHINHWCVFRGKISWLYTPTS